MGVRKVKKTGVLQTQRKSTRTEKTLRLRSLIFFVKRDSGEIVVTCMVLFGSEDWDVNLQEENKLQIKKN